MVSLQWAVRYLSNENKEKMSALVLAASSYFNQFTDNGEWIFVYL
jgi:hypothetical protein